MNLMIAFVVRQYVFPCAGCGICHLSSARFDGSVLNLGWVEEAGVTGAHAELGEARSREGKTRCERMSTNGILTGCGMVRRDAVVDGGKQMVTIVHQTNSVEQRKSAFVRDGQRARGFQQ